ncbi:hypothetical protein R1sor_000028 [Riccia sorocarpa]|uniref:Activator of Hsp90 ATPase AHSA1-like N-terminal domain-containing protein n=1 Tax=Riccia sorocarpa TaxID=122646 RepID=A0ABD3GTW1_9MARC
MEALKKATGYTYWVRQDTQQAAPAAVPKKLSPSDIAHQQSCQELPLGSVWNQAGTWEEKSLNSWALGRVKELLLAAEAVSFPQGTARITEVSSCTGDATLVTVRKKKRVGYSFDITIKFNGELTSPGVSKDLEGTVKLLEAAYGELDDLQLEVSLKDRSVAADEKGKVQDAIGKSLLPALRKQLAVFEAELEQR